MSFTFKVFKPGRFSFLTECTKKLCIEAHKCTKEWARPRKITAHIKVSAREIVQEKGRI
jgi:hypothetical protein